MQLGKRSREGWLVGTKEEVEKGEVNYYKRLRSAGAVRWCGARVDHSRVIVADRVCARYCNRARMKQFRDVNFFFHNRPC